MPRSQHELRSKDPWHFFSWKICKLAQIFEVNPCSHLWSSKGVYIVGGVLAATKKVSCPAQDLRFVCEFSNDMTIDHTVDG